MKNVNEIRKSLNGVLVNVLQSKGLHVRFSQHAHNGCIYVYDTEPKLKNNSKNNAVAYVEYLKKTNESTAIKNENGALIELIKKCNILDKHDLGFLDVIVNQYYHNEKDNPSLDVLEALSIAIV